MPTRIHRYCSRLTYRTVFFKKPMTKKPKTTRPGKVQKIIPSPYPGDPEKAEIAVEGADELYREIRIENTLLEDETGNERKLKQGATVDVVVEADRDATVPKTPHQKTDPKHHKKP